MTTVERLRFAKARIEKGWCRFEMARDAYDRPVDPNSDTAVKWCVFGAIGTCQEEYSAADKAIEEAYGSTFVADWNDEPERTKEDVLALFDKAIALAAEAEARAIQLVEKGEA